MTEGATARPRLPARTQRQLNGLAAGVFVFAIAACWPVLTKRYGFVDDYTQLWHAEQGVDIGRLGYAQGRPVAALLTNGAFAFIHDLSGLAVLRFVSVVSTAALAVLLARAMVSRGYSLLSAWVLAVGTFWLPSTAINVAWSILFFGPLAGVAAGAAAVFLVQADERRLTQSPKAWAQWRTCAAYLLLSVAVLTYQPAAMIFWPACFLLFVAPTRETHWRALLQPAAAAAIVAVAALATGYAGLKIGSALTSETSVRAALLTDPIDKLKQVGGVVLPWAMYPWELAWRRRTGALVGVLLACGLYFAARGRPKDRLLVLVLGGTAMTLGWLPNLLIAENSTTARTLVAVMLSQVVFVAVITDAFVRRARPNRAVSVVVGSAAAAFSFGWMAFVLNGYTAGPAEVEWRRAVSAIRAVPADATGVRVLPAPPNSTLSDKYVDGEFGATTGATFWAVESLTELAYREAHGGWPPDTRFLYPTTPGYEPGTPGSKPLTGDPVLDYRHISNPGSAPAYYAMPPG